MIFVQYSVLILFIFTYYRSHHTLFRAYHPAARDIYTNFNYDQWSVMGYGSVRLLAAKDLF